VLVLELDTVGEGDGVRVSVKVWEGVLEREVVDDIDTDGVTVLDSEIEGVGVAVHWVEVARSS
jgi:hypothetical protein